MALRLPCKPLRMGLLSNLSITFCNNYIPECIISFRVDKLTYLVSPDPSMRRGHAAPNCNAVCLVYPFAISLVPFFQL